MQLCDVTDKHLGVCLSSLMLKGSRTQYFMVGPQSLPSLFLAELGCSVYIPSKDYMLAFSQANRFIKQF